MKKQHQHFIPQTYLRKFSYKQDNDKYFINALNTQTGEKKTDMSVKDICVETDLYTLHHLGGAEKYKVEDFFSDSIEKKYPLVYKMLVTDKQSHVTPDERALILLTTLSMYFRTPKMLNRFVDFSSRMVTQFQNPLNNSEIPFLGYQISLEGKSFAEIKKELKESHRLNYLKTQMALLFEFIKFRINDGISVIELVGDNEFITGDNPVDITDGQDFNFNLFSKGNAIYVPLDPKHVLFIAPPHMESSIDQIFYQRDNNIIHLTVNYSIYKNSERWILGTDKGIQQFQDNSDYFFKPATNDHPMVKDAKRRAELVVQLATLCEKGISNENLELIAFWKLLKDSEDYRSDVAFQDAHRKLKELGLNI